MQKISATPSNGPTQERRQIRLAGKTEQDKRPGERVITHLPASVTVRRAQSPVRRPTTSVQRVQSSNIVPHSQSDDRAVINDPKFFLASDAGHAARTTPVTKPSFFTANSFSNTKRPPTSTPELRRAGSALEVRSSATASTNSKPLTRTPTVREISPVKRANVTPRPLLRQPFKTVLDDSPCPVTSDATVVPHSNESLAEQRASRATMPKMSRKISANSLQASDRVKAGRPMSDTRPGMRPHLEDFSPASMVSDRSGRNSRTLSEVSIGEIDTDLLESPDTDTQSGVSAGTSSLPRQDYFESTLSQPAQSNRKIMDLEIRNTSLMAVNTLLEKQTHKQAKEMKELRKRIVHLTKFPVSNFSAQPRDTITDDESEEDVEDIGVDEDLHVLGEQLLEAATFVDETIRRSVLLSEQLLEDARRGLAYQPRESEVGIGLRRVLMTHDDESEMIEEEGDQEEPSTIMQEIQQLLNGDCDAELAHLESDLSQYELE